MRVSNGLCTAGRDISSIFENDPVEVVQVIRTLKGISQSHLVLGADDQLYVMKPSDHQSAPNLLVNEAVGGYLLQGLDLPTPVARTMILGSYIASRWPRHRYERQHPSIEPRPGIHFGSQLPDRRRFDVYDFLPRTHALIPSDVQQGMYLFDLWSNNLDSRQCIWRVDRKKRTRDPLFIDNKNIFGGSSWSFEVRRSEPALAVQPQPILLDPGAVETWIGLFQHKIPHLLQESLRLYTLQCDDRDTRSLEGMLLSRLDALQDLVNQRHSKGA